jgi:hypothetical protein
LPGPNFTDLYGDNPGGAYYSVEAYLGQPNFVAAQMISVFLCPSDSSNRSGGSCKFSAYGVFRMSLVFCGFLANWRSWQRGALIG